MEERDFSMVNKETTAPPPPPEIAVRTMGSDIRAIGGTVGLSSKAEEVSRMIFDQGNAQPEKVAKPKINFSQVGLILSFVILAIAVLAGAVYVLYPLAVGYIPKAADVSPESATYLPPPPEKFSDQEFYHQSYLRVDADYLTDLRIAERAATSAENLKTFKQQLLDVFSNAPATARLYEFRVRKEDGRAVDALTFLNYIGADLWKPEIVISNFLPDFTAFAYKDSKGNIWPGYVLKLASGKTSLLNGKEILALEQSPRLAQLFLDSPGPQSIAGFKDEIVESVPMRRLDFNEGKESLYYGWFNSRILILSTSKDGLALAMKRLVR